MISSVSPQPRRRRLWLCLLALLGAPFALLALLAANFLTLNRDAVVLRQELLSVAGAPWSTKVQLSAGPVTFWLARHALAWVPNPSVAPAAAALRAVSKVSVGVYRLTGDRSARSGEHGFAAADRTMQARGWVRLVGVVDQAEQVLIYVPAGEEDGGKICVGVVNSRELVVVSATLNPEELAAFLAEHAGGRLRQALAARQA